MSLSLYNELRPLFRLLDDPFANPTNYRAAGHHHHHNQNTRENPGGLFSMLRQPAVDVSEEDHRYIVEAELPGVKKENISITVGDNGRSITIEGREFARSKSSADPKVLPSQDGNPSTSKQTTLQRSNSNQSQLISSERMSRTSFTRTIWLPRAVDGNRVSANLVDGILTLDIPKMEDLGAIKVNIQE